MVEKQIEMLMKAIKKECEKHYPNCETCKFYGTDYYECTPRSLIHRLDRWPKDWKE